MTKRFGLFTALVVAVWLLLVLVLVLFVEGTLLMTSALHLQHVLGMDTQTTHNYASVSGVLPMFVALLGFSGIFVTAYRRINCHTEGCWRIGKHHMAGGKYVICTPCLRKNDGEPTKITVEHIHEQHRLHRETKQ